MLPFSDVIDVITFPSSVSSDESPTSISSDELPTLSVLGRLATLGSSSNDTLRRPVSSFSSFHTNPALVCHSDFNGYFGLGLFQKLDQS
jgi:hypothetical protein